MIGRNGQKERGARIGLGLLVQKKTSLRECKTKNANKGTTKQKDKLLAHVWVIMCATISKKKTRVLVLYPRDDGESRWSVKTSIATQKKNKKHRSPQCLLFIFLFAFACGYLAAAC